MDHLSLLRSLVQSVAGEPVPVTASGSFPPDELRFVLETRNRPSLQELGDRLARLVGSRTFQLARLAPTGLDEFLVVRFPTVGRTLPQRDLFALGYAIADALDLVSAEPDLGSDLYQDPDPENQDRQIEAAGLRGLCQADGQPPADHRWALANSGVLTAWARSKGAGILIAQPDTGVAAHDELEGGMLRLDKARDFVSGDDSPEDPLRSSAANPGHGIGTASVAASREHGKISGAAPQAELVPIRCIEDVKVFNASPVAAAIMHAVRTGCHVISMSLGGVPSRALHAAVREAVEKNLIVIAAAGNCVRTVVWPARYSEVIAVAGTNITGQPWKGSCRGPAVDIAAPGEFVWRAQRSAQTDPTSLVGPGQGTSFATALVAGIAALWLSRHGRDQALQLARQRGVSVQALFKAALKATSRQPAGWDSDDFGAGIVDAGPLLDLELAEIPAVIAEAGAALPENSVRKMIAEELGQPVASGFYWERYATELAAISLAQAKLQSTLAELTPEAKVQATRPSPQLAAAVGATQDSALARFGESSYATVGRPTMGTNEPPDDAQRRLLQALARKGTGLEGSVVNVESALPYLRSVGHAEQMTRLQHILDHRGIGDRDMRDFVLAPVDEALGQLALQRPLSREGVIGLETLVRLTGRPALRLRNRTIDVSDPRASEWQDRLYLILQDDSLQRAASSVGRIDIDGVHVGTGFVAGVGLVLTNRHVLQTFAAPVPRRTNPAAWIMTSDEVTIDFAEEPSSATAATRFRVTGVVGAGPDPIDENSIEYSDLDAALLKVEAMSASGALLPSALTVPRDKTQTDRRKQIIVIGYPARPPVLPRDASGDIDAAVAARLNVIYGSDYGTKYAAPGEILRGASPNELDPLGWVFEHDATTLGGNSGSSVLGFDGLGVAGLHFGGQWQKGNFAHAMGIVGAGSNFLTAAPLNWK